MRKSILCFTIWLFALCSEEGTEKKQNVSSKEEITLNEIIEDGPRFKNFPEPNVASILKYYEPMGTSGFYEKPPSKHFYNPSDSGLFVLYNIIYGEYKLFTDDYGNVRKGVDKTLFMGILITHTYLKEKYGWKASDKDQTFIMSNITDSTIKLSNKIYVGTSRENLVEELGKPIFENDTLISFIGANKYAAKFLIKDNKVVQLIYGRYNISDSIYTRSDEDIWRFIDDLLPKHNFGCSVIEKINKRHNR